MNIFNYIRIKENIYYLFYYIKCIEGIMSESFFLYDFLPQHCSSNLKRVYLHINE